MFASEARFRSDEDSSGAAPIASAVILALRPEWRWEVGGMTVHSIRVVSPGEEVALDAVRRQAAEARGATLLLTAPVLVDGAALESGLFQPLNGRRSVAAAKSALRRSLTKPTDGFFAAWIDRRLSTQLSLLLAHAGVKPDQVTLLALVVFLGILIHVFREERGWTVFLLGAAILIGMAGCMVTEYVRILRPRIATASGKGVAAAESSSARVLWYERLASRDFAYLLPFLAWFGWLRYLVWATAVGVNVFWVVLATFVASRREVSR